MLWIRADGSRTQGLGHVMRTVAVAQSAQARGLDVCYVMAPDSVSNSLPARFGCRHMVIPRSEDLAWLDNVASQDAIVFDGYAFDERAFEAATSTGARVAAIDDFGRGVFPVDVLLNQNPVPRPEYVTLPRTRVLLGPRFALVRCEFTRRRRARTLGPDHRVLVAMGGSDATHSALSVLRAIPSSIGSVTLLVGPGATAPSALGPGTTVVHDPSDVSAVYDRVDVAVTAAGSSTWELLCMGIPVIAIQVAENQRHVGPGVAASKTGFFLRAPSQVDTELPALLERALRPREYARMSTRALSLVDGRGAPRFLAQLTSSPQPSRSDRPRRDPNPPDPQSRA